MTLPYQVTSLEFVPEALRSEYMQDGDVFRLAVDGLPEIDAPGLKSALQKERASVRELQALMRPLGADPHERAAKIARLADVDALFEQQRAAFDLEKKAFESELSLTRQNERQIIGETVLTVALERAGCTDGGFDLMVERLLDRVKIESVDGKRVATITDKDGAPLLIGGKPAGLAHLVNEGRQEFPSLFKGSGAGGGGTPARQPRGGAKQLSRAEFDRLTPTQRTQRMRNGYTIHD